MQVGINSVASRDMISVSSSATITNEIAIPSSVEAGIKSLATRDMISISSSAAIMKGTNLKDVLNLSCYRSDGDEDTEPEMSRPTNRRTASRSPYSANDERIQDKELANSQKESTSCLSLGTQECEDKKSPRSRNRHNSDKHKESDSDSAYHPRYDGFNRRKRRDFEGAWHVGERMSRPTQVREYDRLDRDRHYSKKARRDVESDSNSAHYPDRRNRREAKGTWRVEERMSRHPLVREYDRLDRDRHYSKKARRDVSEKHEESDWNSAHYPDRRNRRESEGAWRVEERMARYPQVREYDRHDKDRYYSKKARHDVSGGEKKEGVEEKRDFSWYAGRWDTHDNRVGSRSRYERRNNGNQTGKYKDVSSDEGGSKRKLS